jgi:ribonuclease P protein component
VGTGPPGPDRPGSSAPPRGSRLPRSSRIRRSEEIRALFRRGKRRRTAHLDVFLHASPVSRPRLGLVVPKHRHSNVERNRLKRRLRELGRTRLLPALWSCEAPVDVLLRARPEAYDASFAQLEGDLEGILEGMCSGRS